MYFNEVFEYPVEEFKKHLTSEGNSRIVFSGKYGSGKTTFLDNIFSIENQEKTFDSTRFEVFRLFPVHYSIASNADILRYIKYDIVIEMLKRNTSVSEVKNSVRKSLPDFIFENIDQVIFELVKMIPKVGKGLSETIQKIEGLYKEYKDIDDKNKQTSEDILVSFLESIENKDGSIYEDDIVSVIIKQSIEKSKERESVLIIDDLDRLDPEHVFRILNVFASQFDNELNSPNKFGFSKIILVCDFQNIRNIFRHRYGTNVDFFGYIDKFYSNDIYQFDNKKAVARVISKVASEVKLECNSGDDLSLIRSFYFQDAFFYDLINLFLDQNLISLRSIVKLINKKIGYHYETLKYSKYGSVTAWRIKAAIQLKLLKDVFGDYEHFLLCLDEVRINEDFLESHSQKFGELVYLSNLHMHTRGRGEESRVVFDNQKFSLRYSLDFSTDQLKSALMYTLGTTEFNSDRIGEKTVDVSMVMLKKSICDAASYLRNIAYL